MILLAEMETIFYNWKKNLVFDRGLTAKYLCYNITITRFYKLATNVNRKWNLFQGLSKILPNLCAVMSLDKFVAFDTITTHTSNQILINQMTVNTYQFISVPVCVFGHVMHWKECKCIQKLWIHKRRDGKRIIKMSSIWWSFDLQSKASLILMWLLCDIQKNYTIDKLYISKNLLFWLSQIYAQISQKPTHLMLITGYYTPSSRNTCTYNSWSGKKDENDQMRNLIVSLIHYFMVLFKIIHDTKKLFWEYRKKLLKKQFKIVCHLQDSNTTSVGN